MYCAKRASIGKIHLLAIINEFPRLLFFLCSMCQLYGNQINLEYHLQKTCIVYMTYHPHKPRKIP